MKVTYSNAKNPKRVKWMITLFIVLCVAFFFIYGASDVRWLGFVFYFLSSFCFLTATMYGPYLLHSWTIDEEEDTLTNDRWKTYPIKISNIATVRYKVSRRGRYQSLLIRDIGAGSKDIKTSRKTADEMVRHLLRLNPDIKVDDSGLNDALKDSVMLRPLI